MLLRPLQLYQPCPSPVPKPPNLRRQAPSGILIGTLPTRWE